MCVIVWTDDWRDPAVYRQSQRACGGSEGSGDSGSSCEPSHGGLVGSVYPLEALWFVRVSVVVGRWYGRVYGVWWWPREVRLA